MVGVTLLLVGLLEVAIRVRRAWAERAPAGPPTYVVGDPRKESWNAEYKREFEAARRLNWRSYVYFRRAPIEGKEISVDSMGYRVTPQPTEPAVPVARVRLFGGSTMWGEPLRAAHTIPAEVARRLQPLAGAGARIDVTNAGEIGYVFTQEVLQLLLDLRAGIRPDLVVFYDGINDVAAAVQRGVAGEPQNEFKRDAEFRLGRQLEAAGSESPLQRDVRTAGTLARLLFARMAIVQWAQARNAGAPRVYVGADSLVASLVRVYEQNARLVEYLAAQYGFVPVYVWQPTLHVSEKQLNPYEQQLRTAIESDSFQVRVQQVHQRVPRLLDSVMRNIAPGRFVDASGSFKGDTQPVFVDRTGHNTENAIPTIVDTFWGVLSRETAHMLLTRSAQAVRSKPSNY